jgi:hypothetical protein
LTGRFGNWPEFTTKAMVSAVGWLIKLVAKFQFPKSVAKKRICFLFQKSDMLSLDNPRTNANLVHPAG